MSSSLNTSPSQPYGPVAVDLQCDFPGAEVLLIDGQQRLVKREVQQLRVNVPPGVYTARVLIGEALRDELIVVHPDKPLTKQLTPPALASAIPLTGSATTHEYHQAAAQQATTTQVPLTPDADAALFILLREWTAEGVGRRSSGPLALELMLRGADGANLHPFDIDTADATPQDRATAQGVRLRAGFYRLFSRWGDAAIEMPVYAIKDWQTQIYLLSQPTPHGLAPDFGRASIVWTRPGTGFDPNREDLRVLESLRAATESGRTHVTNRGLTEALYEKYDNPMLGLVSAHALFQRKAIDQGLLSTVTTNLERMLGPIADVLALKLAVNPAATVPPVEYPPMLRWSWELLLQRSIDRPEIIARYSLAERVGSHTVGRGIWMSWIADLQGDRYSASMQPQMREATAVAARQAWRQIKGGSKLVRSRTKKKSLESAAALESELYVPDAAAVAQAPLRGMVRMLGVPRGVIEEAVGPELLTADAPAAPSTGVAVMNQEKRKQFNERFLQRLMARRPQDRPGLEKRVQEETKRLEPEAAVADLTLDPAGQIRRDPRDLALETIVNRERPVLFVRDGKFDTTEVTALGPEAVELVDRMKQQGSNLFSVLPLIGRIDVVNFPGDFVGTGWFVDTDIVVTNRHVASLVARWDGRKFVFSRGIAGQTIESSWCNAHEFDDLAPDANRIFKVTEVLYIEPDSGSHDIAFLKVARTTDGRGPAFIPVAPTDAAAEMPVCVIGYPARAPRRVIPNQDLMKQLYRDRFDVKRAAPGFTSGIDRGSTTHDCTTLGGNSGSAVLDLATGVAVGLHYAGIYEEDNFAVRASVLTDYIKRKRWNSPPIIETGLTPATTPTTAAPVSSAVAQPAAAAASTTGAAAGGASVTITIPVTLTLNVGTPQTSVAQGGVAVQGGVAGQTSGVVGGASTTSVDSGTGAAVTGGTPPPATVVVDVARVEEVLPDYWDSKPEGVVAARVGYFDKDDEIGDVPCIAASVKPSLLSTFELGGPTLYKGVPVRYLPADVDEQVQALPIVESVDSISYDDDARTGEQFSFAPLNESMTVTMHVGPEYSWEVLEQFLNESQGRLVSAIYEFHARHIKDAIEARLDAGGSLQLVMDNATFGKVHNADESFDREAVFDDWAERFTFSSIIAPEGTAGLISDSYHIKVTVRDDDTLWLSSGNWKAGSSQPIITQQQRDDAATEDLPGNREWHVVIKNKKLASRFRSHIIQDFTRSEELRGDRESPLLDILVDIPIEEAVVLERRPPGKVLKPITINRKVKVRPLLTPDHEGAVYSEAVLDLIQSARTSLLFQIPYIGMPPNPRQNRGFIDDLIKALTAKLKSLDDARVLLRSGGQKFSAPAHAAWFFKSKGVDIKNRLRVIQDHHTKGMIVDGKRVLLGSHNWSKPGVSLNRDASLIFDDEDIAKYYGEAFEIDWQRANPVKPKKFVKPEAVVLEAVGNAPPPGFKRVRLADLAKDDDDE